MLCIQGIRNLIGNKETVLFDIGNEIKDGLLRFDIWFCGVRLTVVDNMAYPPSTIGALKFELNQLKNQRINPDNFWFNFGPIADDFFSNIYLSSGLAIIKVEFKEHIHTLEIPIAELSEIYKSAIHVVSAKNT